ncbi:DUF4349 domain-containing protein [Streptomonospora litoralis]|uniref:DUF4349 domain-containing protein n=1 Tax=Streptomonospora litoralis TaxID=2498135 RepID=UPI0013F169C2|nr:DUF4349 domain-containing protein [Streptomonospora litoralis]
MLLAALSGCAGGGTSSGGQSADAPAGESGVVGPGAGGGRSGEDGQGGQGVQGGRGNRAEGTGEGGDSAGLAADVPLAERDLVHTADMAVEVDGVQKAADAAADWTRSAGGYVAAEQVQTAEGSPPHASLTLHVPQDRYEDALEEFASLGSRSNLDRNVQDVTEQVADVDSRVESAEASLERLRDLLEEAESVEDVLAVERQISTRQEELEALQARQRSLAQQTTYGTVRLELAPPETYVEAPEDDGIGFLGGLQHGWQALVGAVEVLLVVVGWMLPFLLVAAVIGVPGWLAWRRRRRAAPDRAARQPVPAAVGATRGTANGAAGTAHEGAAEPAEATGKPQPPDAAPDESPGASAENSPGDDDAEPRSDKDDRPGTDC